MKQLGQYFTTDSSLQDKVREFVRDPVGSILEPSAGEGDLVRVLNTAFPNNIVVSYEIDKKLLFPDKRARDPWHNEDFLNAQIPTFSTVVANPPFVKSKHGNLYVAFIKKCFDSLSNGGQMVFIIPSDFFKLTQASSLLTDMCSVGSFTDIYWPHDESLFTGASIDVLVFRYEKGAAIGKTCLNDEPYDVVCSNGVVTFTPEQDGSSEMVSLGDICSVHVGLVTGKESVFKTDIGNIELLVGEATRERYILVHDIEEEPNTELVAHLEAHKAELMNRRIRKFTDDNWFEWGALRNHKVMMDNEGTECIYVRTLTRDTRVCFKGHVELYGGSLLMILPKKRIDLDALVSYLNSSTLRNQFIHAGRFKIGQRHLDNLQIPAAIAT